MPGVRAGHQAGPRRVGRHQRGRTPRLSPARRLEGEVDVQRPARGAGGVCRRAGVLSIPEAGERLRGAVRGVGCGGLLDRMHTERRGSVACGRGSTLVRAPSRATTAPPARMAPVQHGSTATHGTEVAAQVLVGTVTCGDGRGWTCCRQMACKRSGVRISLAPLVRSEIRIVRTASTAAKYSNGGPVGRR
jgi:hypothetical protein